MNELQFPKNPVVGQQYDFPPYKYYWDGVKWKTKGIGYNPVNDLRDELEPRIETSEKNIEDLSAQSFEALRRSYAEAGFNLVDGSFEDGGTLTSTSDVLLHKATWATYSWSGVFPKVVNAGSTPATTGGIGAGAWVDRSQSTLKDMLSSDSGDMLGIDLFSAYKLGTIGAHLVPVPGGDNTGVIDSTANFNASLLKIAISGGGVLKPIPGIYKILGVVLLPTNVVLDLTGVTLSGNGANTLIENAAVIGGVLTSIVAEHGTGFDGNGTHATFGSTILNGTLSNAAKGIRGHRMNSGCNINGTFFSPSLGISWEICHSWGMKIQNCTVYAKAKNYSFVDWMEFSNNSFEGFSSVDPNSVAWEFGGGSYSSIIHSNGFHHFTCAISLIGESTNLQIYSNHFEDCRYHVSGDSQTKTNLSIYNNWMKANLAVSESNVIAISLLNARHSKIGPNFYSTDGLSNFDAHVICNTSDCIGNDIIVDHTLNTDAALTLYQASVTNNIHVSGGSNDVYATHRWHETRAGTTGLTVEKYRSRYNPVANSIPLCIVGYTGTTIVIDTFIPTDNFGGSTLAAFNFKINGPVSYIIAGHICHGVVTTIVNADYFSGGSPLPISVSNNAGGMRITITGAPVGGNITGWIKEL